MRHSNLLYITRQYSLENRQQRQELQNCGTYQPCRKFLREDFAIHVILDCRTTSGLGFSQYDPIMTQEQSVLSKIKTIFSAEKIIFQYCTLGYYTDAYFPKHNLAIEVDEQGHHNRNTFHEIERQKSLEKELDCVFIRINLAKENFNVFAEISKIQNHIIKSTKKKLTKNLTKKKVIDDISHELLKLEFKSNNSIKTRCLKYAITKILPVL